MENLKVVVIGGGAAGFFAAINCAAATREAEVILLEKTNKLLSKVRVSGGGRCNVTHACFDNNLLVKQYPRGEKELRNVFSRFSTSDTIKWFEERGVKLKTEEDGRMFPVTDSSETIIRCLNHEAEKAGIRIETSTEVESIIKEAEGFRIIIKGGGEFSCNKVIVASGGNQKPEAYSFLKNSSHSLQKPVPSLFTFNIPDDPITTLMGVSVPMARVRIAGTRLETEGPLLITHWGMSGPAVLKASAWGARVLNDLQYRFQVLISWLPKLNEEKLRIILQECKEDQPSKTLLASCPVELPKRLWSHLLTRAGIADDLRWADLPKKSMNVLIAKMISDEYTVSGKTTFKEEFVTCGGVNLKEIDLATMQSKLWKGLFFAGEVMDVDGVTGGFNFQNAWSSGWIAANNISDKPEK
jgi:predicted Rossmann fold flavoprotein